MFFILKSFPEFLPVASRNQLETRSNHSFALLLTSTSVMLKQNLLYSEYSRFGWKYDELVESIQTCRFPRWIWNRKRVRLSILRANASPLSINTVMGISMGKAKSISQEIEGELSDENDDDLCPVECVTEFKTDEEFIKILEKAKEANSLVVVDFYRTSCGSCKYIEQGFTKLCKQSGDQAAPVIFLKHNVIDEYDEQSEVAERLRIKAVPLFHFYKNGVLLESFATRDKERIDAAILKYTSAESSSTVD